jgi:hypothetical protein
VITLLFAVLRLTSGALLHGHIRSSGDDVPLAAALVELFAIDSSHAYALAYTDSLGSYAFSKLSPGSYRLRVSRVGYDARDLQVLLPDTSPLEIDVALRPQPARLPDVRVFAMDHARNADALSATNTTEREIGSVVLSADALHEDPALTSADALQGFAARGAASTRDEVATSLHVHGGGAGENAVLLDGIPLFNPYHASGTLLAVDPDILASATLHAGAPGATLGDATGGVIELNTAPAGGSSLGTLGAYIGHNVRESISAPLPDVGGSVLIAARHNIDAPLADAHDASHSGMSFDDLFARAIMPLRGGELETFVFYSGDRVGFDARAEADVDRFTDEEASPQRPLSPNTISWNTGTDALRWRSDADGRWDLRAWRTRFDAGFDWAGTTQLHSSYEQLGLSAQSKWHVLAQQLTAGVDASRLRATYDVKDRTDTVGSLLALHGAPLLVAAIGEARGRIGERWSYVLGVREPLLAPGGTGIEPRLSLRFVASSRISFGLAYSRLHQYVQSLRNEESLVDQITGITLPVVAGSSENGTTIPVAIADQATATIDARLSSTVMLSAVGYTRRETGVALVAPVSDEPFATSDFTTGVARSHGIYVSLERRGARAFGELSYSLSSVVRASGSETYTPDFAATHTVSLGVGVRVNDATTLRGAASANSGLSSSTYVDPIEWTPYTPAAGAGDLSGSPQHITGALDGSRLPPYLRIDLGVRHDWRVSLFGVGAQLAGSATVVNLLGRSNAAGLVRLDERTIQLLRLPSRGVELGLEWRH